MINEQLSQDGGGETEASEQPEFFPFDHSQPFVLWQKTLSRMPLQGGAVGGFVGRLVGEGVVGGSVVGTFVGGDVGSSVGAFV